MIKNYESPDRLFGGFKHPWFGLYLHSQIYLVCNCHCHLFLSNLYDQQLLQRLAAVATTITTHPVSQLHFPEVTVCPPRGSNTIMNYVMDKVKDNSSAETNDWLRNTSNVIFVEGPSKRFVIKK